MIQLDTENADKDLTSSIAVLTDTPDASNPCMCQGLIYLGDGIKDLDGTGGDFEITVTIGSQTLEPDPQTITFSTATRAVIFTSAFPVPANTEVVLNVKSPNAGDSDVDVTAYLYDVGSLQPSTRGRTIGVESDGDLTKVNTLDGHTAQTADHTAGIAAIPTTAMRGTDSAALASVCTEGRLAELDAANIPADVDAIPTTAMRGTDSAALASVCTEGRLAELDAANIPADIDAIPTTAMRGTDSAALAATALSTATWTSARAAALTDWIDGGRLDLLLDAIKAATDLLQFTATNQVQVDVQYVNAVQLYGSGVEGDEFGITE